MLYIDILYYVNNKQKLAIIIKIKKLKKGSFILTTVYWYNISQLLNLIKNRYTVNNNLRQFNN